MSSYLAYNNMEYLRNKTLSYLGDNNWTWYQLAQHTGIPTNSLYRFRDGNEMNADNTMKLMQFLNITVDEVIHEK